MSQESDIALEMIYASLSSNGFYILHVSVVSAKEGEKEKASITTASLRKTRRSNSRVKKGEGKSPQSTVRVQFKLSDKQNNRSHTHGQH